MVAAIALLNGEARRVSAPRPTITSRLDHNILKIILYKLDWGAGGGHRPGTAALIDLRGHRLVRAEAPTAERDNRCSATSTHGLVLLRRDMDVLHHLSRGVVRAIEGHGGPDLARRMTLSGHASARPHVREGATLAPSLPPRVD